MANRPQPHSIEAEEYLLSCCFLDGVDVVSRCLTSGLTGRSFYAGSNQILFDVMIDMLREGSPIDIATVSEELKKEGQLDSVGGYAYLTQVSSRIPTTAQAGFFIEKVKEMAMLRDLIARTGAIQERCFEYNGDFEEFSADIIASLHQFNHVGDDGKIEKTAEESAKEFDDIVSGRIRGDERDISIGWADADRYLRKLRRKELVVVAARPSCGKSSFMRQSASHNAYKAGLNTVVFSLEADKREVFQNIVQSISGVNHRDGASYPLEEQRLHARWMKDFGACKNIRIFDRESRFSSIIGRIRAIHAQRPVDIVYIDYLQLVEEKMREGETRDQMIGRMTRTLKNLAMELDCVIVLLSQLNRNSERERNREPFLADLRESGNIEQDADRVIFIHRPTVNPITQLEQRFDDDTINLIYTDILQRKGRNVGVHSIGMNFHKPAARFLQIAKA